MTAAKADPRIDEETAGPAIAAAAPHGGEDAAAVATETIAAQEVAPAATEAAAAQPEETSPAEATPARGEDAPPTASEATPPPTTEDRLCSAADVQQQGVASWYGRHWRGRKTASGQRYDERLLTAASRSLPLPTRARVTNLQNGRSVDVIVNDRGPYVGDRIIDLSARAAAVLGITRVGLAHVEITALPQQPAI